MELGNAWLKKRPEAWTTLAGVVGVLLVDLVDYLTPADVRFAIVYLVPIMAAAWFAGVRPGLIVMIAAATSRLCLEIFVYPAVAHAWVPYLNFVVLCIVFSIVVALASSVRELLARSEERVQQRTAQLQKEIAERKQSELQLRLFMSNQSLIAFVKDEAGRYQYANSTFQKHFDTSLIGKTGFDLFPADVARRLHENDQLVLTSGQTLEFTDSIPFPDGTVTDWINYKFPFKDAAGRNFVGCVSVEITEQRKLEKQLLQISDREQARIGHDLHDQLCQFLVGILFHCQDLCASLRQARSPQTEAADKIAEIINSAINQARQLARGLFPVLLEREGLSAALEELVAGVKTRFKIDCSLQCEDMVSIQQKAVANHLYRIAQEAVQNAAQHAHARHIAVSLGRADSSLELSVRDDGLGLNGAHSPRGMGLHIMAYRARSIGGSLQIKSEKSGGTNIVCRVPLEKL